MAYYDLFISDFQLIKSKYHTIQGILKQFVVYLVPSGQHAIRRKAGRTQQNENFSELTNTHIINFLLLTHEAF